MTPPNAVSIRNRRSRCLLGWLVIAIALIGFALQWRRSFLRADTAAFFTPAGNVQLLASYNGHIALIATSISVGPGSGFSFDWETVDADDAQNKADDWASGAPHYYEEFGFSISTGDARTSVGPIPGKWWAMGVPYWSVMTIAFLIAALQARRSLRLSRRFAAGLCPACGYDLRATTDRCPECGRETPVETIALVPRAADTK